MNKKPHYHFIGIGGIGMSALAHILLDRGYTVSGSDLHRSKIIEKLIDKGASFLLGQTASNVPHEGIVVYGSGISQDNPEYQEAQRRQLPVLHRAELLDALMQGYTAILVSGSHGKTTTTSLITSLFQQAKKDPSYAIGGLNVSSLNGYAGETEFFIAEADESDGSIKHYQPSRVVITNLDDEHLHNFGGSREQLAQTLEKFSQKVEPHHCFYYGDCRYLQGRLKGISYGFAKSNDLYIHSCRQQGWKTIFSISGLGKDYQDIELNLVGKHNVLNAVAAIAVALSFEIEEEDIREALRNFSGVQRRLERKNRSDKFLFLEDYAHHPTEIRCTLRGLRETVGLRRIVAICQPHRFSRLKYCLDQFFDAFRDADEVILTDVYSAGEDDQGNISPQHMAEEIALASHVRCEYVPYGEVLERVQNSIRVHDVYVTLGAGNIEAIGNALRDFEPKKLTVGVIYGGKSCEHAISKLSAKNASQYLSPELYDIHYFFIHPKGLWSKVTAIDAFYEDSADKASVLSPAISQYLTEMDFILPILHGPYGEDGTLQGFLETIDKPYSGPSVLFSSMSMDKIMTKRLASSVGVPVVPFLPLTFSSWKRDEELCLHRITETFVFPMFVKTIHLGSSLGVFEVHNEEELRTAIVKAFLYDTDVLVEESRLGSREIEISCIGDYGSHYVMTEPHERCGQGFINYEEKYGLNGSPSAQICYDLDLSSEQKERVRELAERVYRAIHGQGSCRIDFFLDSEGKFWLSEINSIPGMTAHSPFLNGFVRLGWQLEQVMDQLIIAGLYKFDQKALAESYKIHKEETAKS